MKVKVKVKVKVQLRVDVRSGTVNYNLVWS